MSSASRRVKRHVHPGVRIKNRKCERFRLYLVFTRDHVERRGVGNLPAWTRCHHMARHAARLGEALAVIGVGSQRGRHEHREQQAQAKQLQTILLSVDLVLTPYDCASDRG